MKHFSLTRLAACFALALPLVACNDGADEARAIANARSHLEKQDARAATIELKNTLQKHPNSAVARFLLGQALMRSGAVDAAEIEYRKAADLGYPADEVQPALARAELLLGRAKKVTDTYGATSLTKPEANADLAATVAAAWLAQGQRPQAEQALARALAAQPTHAAARLLQARMKAAAGQTDEALAQADDLLKADPRNTEAWMFKGDVLVQRDLKGAAEAYRQALAADPQSLPAQASLIQVQLQDRQVEAAREQLKQLKKAHPSHPQTAMVEAQFAFLDKDHKKVRELMQQVLRVLPDDPRVLTFSAANELQLGAVVQAQAQLGKALQGAPQSAPTRELLAQTHLRAGQPAKALDVLKPLIEADAAHVRAHSLFLAGTAQLQLGDAPAASSLFSRAAKASPGDARFNTGVAMAQLGSNRDAALASLTTIAAKDSEGTADLVIIGAHLQKGEYDAALKAIDALQRKQPDLPLAEDLKARTLLAKRDRAGARASFERVLSLTPTYMPAVRRLAAMDVEDGKPDRAKARFEAVLKADPKHVDALLGLAQLAIRQRAPSQDVVDLLRQAQRAEPANAEVRVALVDHHLGQSDAKSALAAAQDAAAAIPDEPQVLDALGRAQMVSGQRQQALATFGKAASLQPDAPQPLVRLAGLYASEGDHDRAIAQLKRALELAPDLAVAQQGLVRIALEQGRPAVALDVARSIQKRHPQEASGYVLEAAIHQQGKQWSAARAALDLGLKQSTAKPAVAVRLHELLLAQGQREEADRFAADWLKRSPRDTAFLLHLGVVALRAGAYPEAEARLQDVLRVDPDQTVALNNLAWVMARQGKAGGMAHIQKALARAPEAPELLDTQAYVLEQAGDLRGAIDAQRRAVALAPAQDRYRLTLAKLHLKAGDRAAAKPILQEISQAASAPAMSATTAGRTTQAKAPPNPTAEEAKKLLAGL